MKISLNFYHFLEMTERVSSSHMSCSKFFSPSKIQFAKILPCWSSFIQDEAWKYHVRADLRILCLIVVMLTKFVLLYTFRVFVLCLQNTLSVYLLFSPKVTYPLILIIFLLWQVCFFGPHYSVCYSKLCWLPQLPADPVIGHRFLC